MPPTPRHPGHPAPRRRSPRQPPGVTGTRRPSHRRRTILRRRSPRKAAPPPLVDLWPCADAEQLPGTTALAGWLGQTILTLVTRYTRPGDRVLLLAPPTRPVPAYTLGAFVRQPDPYAGLTEALWTVTRLGRSTDTAVADTALDALTGHRHATRLANEESETGPGHDHGPVRPPDDLCLTKTASLPEHRHADGTFDLIVTAVHPRFTGWHSHVKWDRLLTPSGLIATVTHSDIVGGRFVDPTPNVVETIRSHRRRWLEHIVVLTRPVAAETHSPSAAGGHRPSGAETRADTSGPAYHDLIIGALPSWPVTGEVRVSAESSDA